jgi:hypothetical protein
VLLVPDTVAVNCCWPFSVIAAVVGVTLIEIACGADTLTVAEADFVESAALVAVTEKVPAELGAA